MKNLFLILILLISFNLKGQDNSVASSVLTPVANQTGVPDISFPIAELAATKDFIINIGLVYNPNAYRMGEYSGQVARNWMLTGSNFMITRKVINTLIDEAHTNNAYWDDIYYYTLNGEQGSFKFERTGSNSNNYSYQIIKLTPSNIKIEFERETIGYNLQPVKSFTITDSKGYKYYFQDYDYQSVSIEQGKNMRNTFYVTKIKDPKGRQIITYTNKRFTKYQEHNPSQPKAWTYLPEKIQTDYGSILIGHAESNNTFEFQDRFHINSFALRDHKENVVSQYNLSVENISFNFYHLFDEYYGLPETRTISARILTDINRIDKQSEIIEKTKFVYHY